MTPDHYYQTVNAKIIEKNDSIWAELYDDVRGYRAEVLLANVE